MIRNFAMLKSDISSAPGRWSGLSVHLRGHVLLFDARPAHYWEPGTGVRLLLIAIAIEALRLMAIRSLNPMLPLLFLVLLFLAGALALIRFAVPLKLSQIGLYRWREWSA